MILAMILDFAALMQLMLGVGAPPELARIMAASAITEAPAHQGGRLVGANPQAIGDGGRSRGLFQINDVHGLSAALRHDPTHAAQWMLATQFQPAYQRGVRLGYHGEELAAYTYIQAERPVGFPSTTSPAALTFRANWRLLWTPDQGEDDDVTSGEQVIQHGAARIGIPYRIDPPPDGVNNLDCSLFTRLTLRELGVNVIGRTAEQQRGWAHASNSLPISMQDAQPGDYIFFFHTYEPSEPSLCRDGKVASHIGFFVDRNTFLDCHAANGESGPPGVGYSNLAFWTRQYQWEIRRVPGVGGEDMARIAELEAQVAGLETRLGYIQKDVVGVLRQSMADVREYDPQPRVLGKKNWERRFAVYEAIDAALNTVEST